MVRIMIWKAINWLVLVGLIPLCCLELRAAEVDAQVCVFGGTAGGVVTAVQAARIGKTSCSRNSAVIWAG